MNLQERNKKTFRKVKRYKRRMRQAIINISNYYKRGTEMTKEEMEMIKIAKINGTSFISRGGLHI